MSKTRSVTVDEFMVDEFADMWEFSPRIASRIFATLLLSGTEQSSRELMEQLGVSSASISTMGRYLAVRGLVERRVSPETRRDLFRVPVEAWERAHKRDEQYFRDMNDWLERAVTYAAQRRDGRAGVAPSALLEMREFFAFLEEDFADQLARYLRWRTARAEREPAE
jgi:DNA-binding transcriptional regulator GbsR (MarR family)